MNTTDSTPTECQHFEERIHAVLDGSTPAHTLNTNTHAMQCAHCSARLQAVVELQRYTTHATAQQFQPSPLLASRILDALKNEPKKPRHGRTRVITAMLAASLLLACSTGIWYFAQTPQQQIVEVPIKPMEPARVVPQPNLSAQFADASDALSAITRKTTEKATAPTRTIWQTAERATTPQPKPIEPPMPKLPDVQQVARASFEPMANSTRRALNLFVRDFGIAEPR